MKNNLLNTKIVIPLLFLLFYVTFHQVVSAQAGLGTAVSGRVGGFNVSLSGYIAPFATISLASNQTFISSASANGGGYFFFTNVLLRDEDLNLCFDAIDLKSLGQSYSCLDIDQADVSKNVENIFLPPTLGLLKSEISEGSLAVAYGYSMPGATVNLSFADTKISQVAGEDGYYEFTLKDVKAGTYELYASASLSEKSSLEPKKAVTLKVLSSLQDISKNTNDLLLDIWKKIVSLLTSIALQPLWLAIPLIILIIILLKKLYPKLFSIVLKGKFLVIFPYLFRRRGKNLHHDWMIGG